MKPPGRDGLFLLEVGLRWPPESFLRWKLEALAARGMRVAVASRSIADPSAGLVGVELIPLPQPDDPLPSRTRAWLAVVALLARRPGGALRLLRGIRSLGRTERRRYGGLGGLISLYLPLARLRPDIVHFEWVRSALLYQPMVELWGSPAVVSCHGSHITVDPHVPGQERFASQLAALFSSVATVHCVSDKMRRIVCERGAPPAATRVIRQGVDPTVFSPAAGPRRPSAEPLRVVVVGWPRWMKGFEWALTALRDLLDRGVSAQLEIVGAEAGEATERRRLIQTIDDLGLSGQVHLSGVMDSPGVAERMRSSDVLLLPSLEEGLPTVLLEAMASGIPVVASDCGAVREAVSDGVEGLVVSPRDAVGLAGALERLAGDPGLRERMGRAGRRTATSRFTLERQLDEFSELYENLVAGEWPWNRVRVVHAREAFLPAARPRSPSAGPLRLLSAGPLIWEQGYEHSIHAVRLLLDTGVACTYRIVGDGNHLPAVAFARQQLGLTGHVELLMPNGNGQLVAELRQADVFLDPSVTATTSPTPVQAAQASGLPVVVTAGEHRQVGDAGITVPRRDPRAMAEALARVADQRLHRETLSRRS